MHVSLKDKDGNTPLHILFSRKKAILESSEMKLHLDGPINDKQLEPPRKKYAELSALEVCCIVGVHSIFFVCLHFKNACDYRV